MKLLASSAEIDAAVQARIRASAQLVGAVAWASDGFPAGDLILRSPDLVERLVVGLHFYQTDPDFIERSMHHPGIRFITSTKGTFHPKGFLFRMPDGTRSAIIGSANLTAGGFGANEEMGVLVEQGDTGADALFDGIESAVGRYWGNARAFGPDDLQSYRSVHLAKRKLIDRLAGRYGSVARRGGDDRGAEPLACTVLRRGWPEFASLVQADDTLGDRLRLLELVRQAFGSSGTLGAMTPNDRRMVGGVSAGPAGGPDWRLFGSMKGAGTFTSRVVNDCAGLSAALDEIPSRGEVSRSAYDAFVDGFQAAFAGQNGGGDFAVATATRLLAMKRPDAFVCVDSKNRHRLCSAFGIGMRLSFDSYWASVCERVYDSAWWNAPEPAVGIEAKIWRGRAALMDCLYYEPG